MFSVEELNTGIDRLTTLANHLEKNVKKSRFDLDDFINHDVENDNGSIDTKKQAKEAIVKIKEGFCNTSACAVGHAATIPEFIDLGFKIQAAKNQTWDGSRQFYELEVVFKNASGNKLTSFDAAQDFFSLSLQTTYNLFDPNEYDNSNDKPKPVSKARVVKSIKKHIAKMKKEVKQMQKVY